MSQSIDSLSRELDTLLDPDLAGLVKRRQKAANAREMDTDYRAATPAIRTSGAPSVSEAANLALLEDAVRRRDCGKVKIGDVPLEDLIS